MACIFCNKTKEETALYDGIYKDKIAKVCKTCAEIEGIPLIKKPSQDQLQEADRTYSVKERMKKLSGMTTPVSREQSVAFRNLARLRLPDKRQQPDNLVDNYYWVIQQARRRKKLPISHIAQQTGVSQEILEGIEKGQLPSNFEPILQAIEHFFSIELFRNSKKKLVIKQPSEECNKKIENNENKENAINQLVKGELDFSNQENLQNITLNDLIELKKNKEKKHEEIRNQKYAEQMFGNDLEIEE